MPSSRRSSTAAAPPPDLQLPVRPGIEAMLCKPSDGLPEGDGWLFEPKWDGFRCLVFRDGPNVFLQSREGKPLARYFPEVVQACLKHLPTRCVLDGEIVIATPRGLDFGALQLRLHPAASRVDRLAGELPASLVAFDVLALGDDDLTGKPQVERRAALEQALASAGPPVHLTPMTRRRDEAADWFQRFEGAGLDGVIAKPEDLTYQPGARAMVKIKHARTADCLVAGFRWHKGGENERVGSLLLGLYDDAGQLQHVGITASFTMAKRAELVEMLAPLRADALVNHPWAAWSEGVAEAAEAGTRMPGGHSRWNANKDLSWQPLRLERVVEVKFDHLEGNRFRHAATFVRWRPDKAPAACDYRQIDVTPPYELARIFDGARVEKWL